MANEKGITTGSENSNGITTGTEQKGGITTGTEQKGGITTGNERESSLPLASGIAISGGYELADCRVPVEKILALIQDPNGAWAGFVLQDSNWSPVFQTHDWRVVLDYSSRNSLLIKQAYPHPLTLEMSGKYPPIPAANWGWE